MAAARLQLLWVWKWLSGYASATTDCIHIVIPEQNVIVRVTWHEKRVTGEGVSHINVNIAVVALPLQPFTS
jgi:hypothetical protein